MKLVLVILVPDTLIMARPRGVPQTLPPDSLHPLVRFSYKRLIPLAVMG